MKRTRAIGAGALSISCVAAGFALSAAVRVNAQAPDRSAPPPSTAQQTGTPPHGGAGGPVGQGGPSNPNQTAEQRFKNIQVLKTIPADQLIPSMQFIAASLGVDCEFCHVAHANEKDDKKPKLVAREMMTMMMKINADNFKGEREVTCYSCHRGAVDPVGTPQILANAPARPGAAATGGAPSDQLGGEAPVSATSDLPSAQSIIEKYLAAVGGAGAIQAVKTRKQSGYLLVDNQTDQADRKIPIEIFSEGPDKRISNSHMPSGDSVTAYNGTEGWLTTPGGVRPMNAQEAKAASIDAQLYFPVRLAQLYQEFKVQAGEIIGGKATWLVLATGRDEPGLNLYFDQDSGLLLRQVRYTETALGRLPTQIDFGDYRKDGGVTIPYRWTLARVNGRFTIEIESVKDNIELDEKLFVMPPPGPQSGQGRPPGPGGAPSPH